MRISSLMPSCLLLAPGEELVLRADRWAAALAACVLCLACGSGSSASTSSSGGACALIAAPVTDPPALPPGAGVCPPGGCDYQTQSGCADTAACRPSFNATDPVVNPGCESVGSGMSGADCTLQSDCARGYYCVAQQCHKLCCGNDWSVCPTNESCFVELSVRAGGQVLPSGAALCYPVNQCNPFGSGDCPSGRECKIVDSRGSVACLPTSQAQAGQACSAPNFCAQGLICVETDATSKLCRKLCVAEACGTPACAPEEGLCQHFSRDPEGVGECTPGATG